MQSIWGQFGREHAIQSHYLYKRPVLHVLLWIAPASCIFRCFLDQGWQWRLSVHMHFQTSRCTTALNSTLAYCPWESWQMWPLQLVWKLDCRSSVIIFCGWNDEGRTKSDCFLFHLVMALMAILFSHNVPQQRSLGNMVGNVKSTQTSCLMASGYSSYSNISTSILPIYIRYFYPS